MVTAMQSSMATSTCSPFPHRRASLYAATAPSAAYVPVTHSPIRPPAASGGFSGSPRWPVDPHAACRVNSVLGRSAHGPSQPNGVIVTTTRAGFTSHSAWRSTGPPATRRSAAARSSASPRTDLLEVLRNSKRAPEPQLRKGSPVAGSTLTTSAPASASTLVQYGPAMSVVKSTTRIPSSICWRSLPGRAPGRRPVHTLPDVACPPERGRRTATRARVARRDSTLSCRARRVVGVRAAERGRSDAGISCEPRTPKGGECPTEQTIATR